MGNPAAWDRWLFRLGNGGDPQPWLDGVFLWLSAPPDRLLWFGLGALLLATLGGRRGRVALLLLILAVALSDQIAASGIKPAFDRLRPCFALPETRLLLPAQARSASFPSNHAANTFAAALVLFSVRPLLGWMAVALAGLVAASRVYVGVHYPSDVLAGAVLGIAIGLSVRTLGPRLQRWLGSAEVRLLSALRPSRGAASRGSGEAPRQDQGGDRNRRSIGR